MTTMENLDFEHSAEDLIIFMAEFDNGDLDQDHEISRFFGYGEQTYTEAMREDLHTLRAYAENKFAARVVRKQGLIECALKLETLADGFYNQLSESVRW